MNLEEEEVTSVCEELFSSPSDKPSPSDTTVSEKLKTIAGDGPPPTENQPTPAASSEKLANKTSEEVPTGREGKLKGRSSIEEKKQNQDQRASEE